MERSIPLKTITAAALAAALALATLAVPQTATAAPLPAAAESRIAPAPPPVTLASASWIWYPQGDARVSAPVATRYFRRTFTAPSGTVSNAQLVITGDDTVDVWLNGTPLAASPRSQGSWQQATYVDLAAALRTGDNTLAVAVRNTTASPAGTLGHVRVTASGGSTDLVTDAAWKASQSAPQGWEQPAFDDKGWVAATNLGAYGIAPWHRDVAAPNLAAASALSIVAATTERQNDPLGVDAVHPRFSWQLSTAGRGKPSTAAQQNQGAYQIIVASSADRAGRGIGDVWDSGRVASQRSVDVEYGGPALASLTRYHWRVRVWDSQGRASGWGATRYFETGLFNPATEWGADFIGQSVAPVDLSGASWIWYPEGDPVSGVPVSTRYFRRTISLSAAPTQATLVVTGDDTADVWVNGTPVSTSPRIADSWKQAASLDVAARLTAGTNTIAIATQNTSQSPAGVVAKLVVGAATVAVTDGAWKASDHGDPMWSFQEFRRCCVRVSPSANGLPVPGCW
jgi:alpha-L-rhamnosidase